MLAVSWRAPPTPCNVGTVHVCVAKGRVLTAQGKQGKWPQKNPCQEKHREFEKFA